MGHRRGKACSRRDLLRGGAALGGGLVASPLLLNLAACGDAPAPDDDVEWNDQRTAAPDDVVFGLYPRSVLSSKEAVAHACKSLDFSWLGAGDSVLVKIASNSGLPHPATTSPAAVKAIAAELFSRGAGRVIVGEQSGVEYVRLIDGEVRHSSTAEQLAKNGLGEAIEASGAEAHFFDDQGYTDGYIEATPPAATSWKQPMLIPKIVSEVDHIVLLPRLASHVLAGATCGLKLGVGWLRDDSRNHLHHDFETFYEKYVDIAYCAEIRSRFRLALTLAESLLLDFGPDTGTVHVADPVIVIASQNLANHDAVATSVLVHVDAVVERGPGLAYSRDAVDGLNRLFMSYVVPTGTGLPWGPGLPDEYTALAAHAFEEGIAQDRAIARAFAISGGAPEAIDAMVIAEQMDPALAAALDAHSGGIVRLV